MFTGVCHIVQFDGEDPLFQLVRPVGTSRIICFMHRACPTPYPARSTLNTTDLNSLRMPPHLPAHDATHTPPYYVSSLIVHRASYSDFV